MMKTALCVIVATLLMSPVFGAACDLEVITSKGHCVRHYGNVSYATSALAPYEFSDLFATAVANWRKWASIGIYIPTNPETEIEMDVQWLDTSVSPWDPTDEGLASCSVYWDPASGSIYYVRMRFPSDHLFGYVWDWSNTCPAPACEEGPCYPVNIVTTMMHELGHALGFNLLNEYAAGGSVMSTYDNWSTCYTELQTTGAICAQYLYPAEPVSNCAHFIPVISDGGVSIKWQTEYEYETDHFLLEKRQPGGSFAPISEPIMSVGSAHDGAKYEYLDPTGTRSDIYRLMEVDRNGIVLGTAQERVLLEEPSGGAPVVLTEAERAELHKDIDALLEGQMPKKENPRAVVTSGGIEWLAIYPAAFSDAVTPLITYRDLHGYNASGITYEYVQSEYGTITAYLQNLWSSQGQALKYVVIVGDDDRIPAERCTDGDVGDFYANYLTDIITVDLAGDWLPELSVGRIPAASADEVSIYVAKALEYEGQEAADWNNHITFFVDDRDGAFGYQSGPVAANFAQELIDFIPPWRTLHYENMLANLPYDQCSQRSHAISEFNEGRGTVLAFGSTASEYDLACWLETREFYDGCAFSGSQLSQNHKYAFVLGASCDIGDMNATSYPWIVKELLFQRYSGAIACFAPSGSTWQGANYDICAGILDYLYSYGTPTVGYACYMSQKHEMSDWLPGNAHTACSYLFYGDPAIELKGSVSGDPPIVTVTEPNGGEYYHGGTVHITWHVQDEDVEEIRCTVQINYSYNIGSQVWDPLVVNRTVDAAGDGSFDFRLASGTALYDHCRIKVFATDICNNEGSDMSDADFTIQLVPKPSGEPIPKDPVISTVEQTRNFLDDPRPNPFNPTTTITFGLKEPAQIMLTIYNVNGAVIKSLYKNEIFKAGTFTLQWDGTNDRGAPVSSGIYFLRLTAGSFSETKRLILLR